MATKTDALKSGGASSEGGGGVLKVSGFDNGVNGADGANRDSGAKGVDWDQRC